MITRSNQEFNKALKKELPKIKQALINMYGNVRPDIDTLWQQLFSKKKADERISLLLSQTNTRLTKKTKILEVGSGFGFTTYCFSKLGATAYGIEPDDKVMKVVTELYKTQIRKKQIVFSRGVGEKLPYRSNMFDIVMSFQVIEHVQDPKKVLKESYRVLKKGGIMYHVIPNYNSFWEGHYATLWLPNLLASRFLARAYLKIFHPKKDINFLNEINNITPDYILPILKRLPNAEIMTMGKNIFIERMKNIKYLPKWGKTYQLSNLKKVLQLLHLDRIIAHIFVKMNWYYPLVVIVRKKA